MKLQDIIADRRMYPLMDKRLWDYVGDNAVEFNEVLRAHPLKDRTGAISVGEAFWLYCLARDVEPNVVVESGTMFGWSAYFLRHAVKTDVDIHSFDPDERDPINCSFHHKYDWSKTAFAYPLPSFVFFDDHQHQGDRLQQAIDRNVRDVVFHDNYLAPDHSHVPIRFCELPADKVELCFTFPPMPECVLAGEFGDLNTPYRWLTWLRLKG